MNEVNNLFGYLQVSAAAHGLHPKILGYGDVAWWPDGLGAKINALRRYVLNDVGDKELVLFVDAFDVMVFGGREDIVHGFEVLERQQNRSLFFNCEKACFPPFNDICTEDYPQTTYARWRYLNSGAMIGRGAAFKLMLRDPVDDIMPGSDQAFYQRYYRDYPDRVGVDSLCRLLCATQGVGEAFGIEVRNNRVENVVTGTAPSIVHFVSDAHWAVWRDGAPTTALNDVFREMYPVQSERLFDAVDAYLRVGGSHRQPLLRLRGDSLRRYYLLMRSVLCLQCRVLGSSDRECTYASSLGTGLCTEVGWCVLLTVMSLGLLSFACVGRRRPAFNLQRSIGRVFELFSKVEKAV